MENEQECLKEGDVFKKRYRVVKRIGKGGYGEVYCCEHSKSGDQVAVKIERPGKKTKSIRFEASVLRKLQGNKYICRFIHCGRYMNGNYIVMELIGSNLSELRIQQPERRFSVSTALRLSLQMLKAIESLHSIGIIHRDIKPSNFAMGRGGSKDQCYILDFGLSKRYKTEAGKVRPERIKVGFRGTARYASVNAHEGKDLSQRDDLWSLLYCVVEFLKGGLPWSASKDRAEIRELKLQYHNRQLFQGLPLEFSQLFAHLNSLKYGDKPDYPWIESLFRGIYEKSGHMYNTPYDWEIPRPNAGPSSSAQAENQDNQTNSENDECEQASSEQSSRSDDPKDKNEFLSFKGMIEKVADANRSTKTVESHKSANVQSTNATPSTVDWDDFRTLMERHKSINSQNRAPSRRSQELPPLKTHLSSTEDTQTRTPKTSLNSPAGNEDAFPRDNLLSPTPNEGPVVSSSSSSSRSPTPTPEHKLVLPKIHTPKSSSVHSTRIPQSHTFPAVDSTEVRSVRSGDANQREEELPISPKSTLRSTRLSLVLPGSSAAPTTSTCLLL